MDMLMTMVQYASGEALTGIVLRTVDEEVVRTVDEEIIRVAEE